MASKVGQRLTPHEEAALFGHALKDKDVWRAVREVGGEFQHGPLNEVYQLALEQEKKLDRKPSLTEFEAAVEVKYSGTGDAPGHLATVRDAVEKAQEYGLDAIKLRLSDWAKAAAIKKRADRVQKAFNDKDLTSTVKEWKAATAELEAIEASINAGADTLKSSSDRMEDEAEDRAKDADKHLEYGIPFLDDDLGGLLRRQFVMVGADTGVGKTDFARLVGLYNAKKGRRVHGYFLEADVDEIERRTKFPMLIAAYVEDTHAVIDPQKINYTNWIKNQCSILDKYNAQVDALYRHDYSTFHTYYRNREGFSADTLRQSMLAARNEADLFIVDHLQYIDLDSDQHEVAETTKLVMSMRETILTTGIPILCISHLKKSGRTGGLLADLPDFHGSSNITKIATTCIVLAPWRECELDFEGRPGGFETLIQAVKTRVEGERGKYVGLCYYDTKTGTYSDRYSVGKLDPTRNKFFSIEQGRIPGWWPNQNRILYPRGEDIKDGPKERA